MLSPASRVTPSGALTRPWAIASPVRRVPEASTLTFSSKCGVSMVASCTAPFAEVTLSRLIAPLTSKTLTLWSACAKKRPGGGRNDTTPKTAVSIGTRRVLSACWWSPAPWMPSALVAVPMLPFAMRSIQRPCTSAVSPLSASSIEPSSVTSSTSCVRDAMPWMLRSPVVSVRKTLFRAVAVTTPGAGCEELISRKLVDVPMAPCCAVSVTLLAMTYAVLPSAPLTS